MTEKRQRKNNWTQLENQKLEKALQMYGRADIQKIVDFLRDNLSDFNRSFKDVKKKIYNQLQEDIIHEISVKVRINLTYSLLNILQQQQRLNQHIIQKLSKFSGHNAQRIEQNMNILQQNEQQLNMGRQCINKVLNENQVFDATTVLLENNLYKKVLMEFRSMLD